MGQRQKIKSEEKLSLIRQIINGEISIKEASGIAGVHWSTVDQWKRQYEVDGVDAFLPQEQNRAYSSELKLRAVRDYLSGAGSILDICQKYKVRDAHQLRDWIKVYNAHGDFHSVKYSGGGSYMMQGRDTTQGERIRIAKECIASDKNYGEMALKYNVSYQQARTWTLRFEALGEAGLEDRRGQRKKDQKPRTELERAQIEIEQLKHKLYLAEMENTLLKKLDEVERRSVSGK